MLKLFLIRHGLTEWNKINRFQGSSDVPLSEEGIWQAKKLAEKLKKYSFDAIYVSDLKRAYETGKYIANVHNLNVQAVEEFREIHFGRWEGLTQKEILQLDEYKYLQWKESPHISTFPGEGNLIKVQQRVTKGIHRILEEHGEGNIVIVSHGGVLKVMILSLLEIDLSLYNKFWLGNTSISIVEISHKGNILSLLNDMSHLHYTF